MTFTAVLYGDTPEPHTRDTSLATPDTRGHSGVNGQSGQESGRQGLQPAPSYYNIRHKTSDPPLACDSSTHVDVCEDIKPCAGGGGGWCWHWSDTGQFLSCPAAARRRQRVAPVTVASGSSQWSSQLSFLAPAEESRHSDDMSTQWASPWRTERSERRGRAASCPRCPVRSQWDETSHCHPRAGPRHARHRGRPWRERPRPPLASWPHQPSPSPGLPSPPSQVTPRSVPGSPCPALGAGGPMETPPGVRWSHSSPQQTWSAHQEDPLLPLVSPDCPRFQGPTKFLRNGSLLLVWR